MLDINLFREEKGNNPEIIRDSQRKRFARVELVDEVINLDREWRQRQFEVENLRKEFNKLNKQIANLKISGGDATELIQQTEKNKEDVSNKEKQVNEAYSLLKEKLKEVGNLVDDSVPVSEHEADNAVIKLWGEKRVASPGQNLKNHVDLAALLDIVDTKRGAEIAGGRGFFLKGDGVLLNQALINFGLKFMKEREFTLLQPPFFMRKKVMAKCAQLDNFDEQLYKVTGDGDKKNLTATAEEPLCDDNDKKDLTAAAEEPLCDGNDKKNLTAAAEKPLCDGSDKKNLTAAAEKPLCDGNDKYLIATAEQPLCAYHMDEWIHPSKLPIKYAGYSTCFRKEANSHGRDELGIFRVHQFEKIEQFCITCPNDNKSSEMLEKMMENSEDFYKALKLPYRVVSIVSGALNDAAAKKYDLEAWFPSSETYRELVSCSNCTDYQARRLEIRYGQKKSNEQTKQYVHMLNSTLTATERTLCCILENYQREDGVEIPEALQKFMGGETFLPFKAISL